MYNWYALLFHLPSIFITASLTQHLAAVVAAPLLKVCPDYADESTPADVRALRTLATNL